MHFAKKHRLALVLDVMTKDTEAIRLYERLGWTRLGTAHHDDGQGHQIDAITMAAPVA